MLHAPTIHRGGKEIERRERILLMGGPGSGKTRAWMSVASWMQRTGSDKKMFVIDTDLSFEAMIEGFPKLGDWEQLIVYEPVNFPDYQKAIKGIRAEIQPGDWIVVDLIEKAWEEAQNHYSQETYGMSKADYFLARRQDMKERTKNFQPFEGWTDWTVIKPMYQDFSNSVFYGHKAHVLTCSGIKPVNRGTDSKEIVEIFSHLGSKPEGEKRLPHQPHTILRLTQKDADKWVMDTAKDRERVVLNAEPLKDFVRDYLLKIAGWRL